MSKEWTPPAQSRCSINWLAHTLDSAPSNTANVFGLDDERPAETHAVTSSEGVIPFSEGANSRPEGDQDHSAVNIDPISGETVSPLHTFTVDSTSSLKMPPSINFAEAGLRGSTRDHQPTARLIESPLFGLSAV